MDNINQNDINKDIDYIIKKTQKLFTLVEQGKYHLVDTKEVVRQQLIDQFFTDFSPEQIATVGVKFEQLIELSTTITEHCESAFSQVKQDILKIKKAGKIKKAYR